MQCRELGFCSLETPGFERVAGIHNPSGGGVHEFQFFNSGSADRGERRLTAPSE